MPLTSNARPSGAGFQVFDLEAVADLAVEMEINR